MTQTIKMKAGDWMIPVVITEDSGRLFFQFRFNRPLMEEIKLMEGAKWHGYEKPPRKVWSVANTQRNRFQIQYLAHPGSTDLENPYLWYERPLVEFTSTRPLYKHQYHMSQFGLTYRQIEFACEMGTGKTLAAIEVMEHSDKFDWIWAAPKSALASVKLEFRKWGAKIQPRFMTYEALKKLITNWPEDVDPPQGLICDEASRLKNPHAQRTIAVRHLADAMRAKWGKEAYIIEMSGSPAPKSPADWWSQCEIACPGFLKEGNIDKFKRRLAIIEQREGTLTGGAFPYLVSWKDDDLKCNTCGRLEDDSRHDPANMVEADTFYHPYIKSVNEVAFLYKRMEGLVLVKFKKDCLDLPDKIYRLVNCEPTHSILNAARVIEAKCSTTIKALTLLRELSDGFQYVDTVVGQQVCELCHGTRTSIEYIAHGEIQPTPREFEMGHLEDVTPLLIVPIESPCVHCSGTGVQDRIEREAKHIPTPKEQALKDLLEEHEDVGRLVIYGGFTGSIDRITSIVQKVGWDYIRVDGRGWHSNLPGNELDLLSTFQERLVSHEKVAFIGQSSSAGMGLNLTASPSIVYYSNDFNSEGRIQSEDRIHRPGMDLNRGATIIDLIHLPTDLLVLENLKKKRRLQDISMGQFRVMLDQYNTTTRAF